MRGCFVWVFVKGWMMSGADHRTAIILSPGERDLIVSEMRMLFKAIHGALE